MKKIILDANFLVLPFQFNVRIFDELERLFGKNFTLFTLDRCLEEAKNLKQGRYSKMVTALVDNLDLEVITTSSPIQVDQMLVNYAGRGYALCTNDKGLKEKLEDKGIPYIYLRQKNHLAYSAD